MNLDELLQHAPIRHVASAPAQAALPSGFDALDTLLQGGWPRAALTEILTARKGIGELHVLLPALAEVTRQKRWVAFVAPPYLPHTSALTQADLDLSRVLLIHPSAQQDGLCALEQALRGGTCGAVLAWPAHVDFDTLQRLQLAAKAGNAWCILFRPAEAAQLPSPAALRLKLEPLSASGRTLAVQVITSFGDAGSCRTVLGMTPVCASDTRRRANNAKRTAAQSRPTATVKNRPQHALPRVTPSKALTHNSVHGRHGRRSDIHQ